MSLLGATAPFPQSGVPASQYFGSTATLAATGTTNSTQLTPAQEKMLLIVVGIIVVGGYLMFHVYHGRG